jgi:DNA-binding winged helix-turn-helix (wHTH) protein
VLVDHHGRLLGKDELIKAVWSDTFVEEGSLSWYVSHLRKELSRGENGQHYIETMPKRGYRFVADVREAPNGRRLSHPMATRLPLAGMCGSFVGNESSAPLMVVVNWTAGLK